jgi:hypothetical protein
LPEQAVPKVIYKCIFSLKILEKNRLTLLPSTFEIQTGRPSKVYIILLNTSGKSYGRHLVKNKNKASFLISSFFPGA